MENNEKGVWRTIKGRRVFIRSGESLGSAMARSGKFKREDVREAKTSLRAEDYMNKIKNKSVASKKYQKETDKYYKKTAKKGEYTKFGYEPNMNNQAEKSRINENAETQKFWQKRTLRNYDKYSETDKREIAHENLQKKLAEYKENTLQDAEESLKSWRIYRDRNQKSLDRAKNPESKKRFLSEVQDANKEIQKAKETIDNFKAKKQSNNKVDDNYYKGTKRLGFGYMNDDNIPVYNNKIDYTGDFGGANLSKVSDDDLIKALNKQSELYHEASNRQVGDGRTRNGRMDRIFKNAEVGKYEQGMKKINEEMQKRDMPRYNIYDKKNPNNILASSPTKEMADRQIQDMYKTDMALQKEYGWKELPKYDYKVGKVDENLNEIKKQETIKKYVEKKQSNKKLSKADEKYESTKKDVLEYFGEDYGYENTTPEKALVEQIDYMRIPGHSIYQTAKEYAEGGSMLIYNQDMADYLKTKGIKATENNAFDKYTDYMAKNIEKMYNEFKKKGK